MLCKKCGSRISKKRPLATGRLICVACKQEEQREYTRRYRDNHPDSATKQRPYSPEYYREHKAAYSQASQRYYNKEGHHVRSTKWHGDAQFRAKRTAYNQRYWQEHREDILAKRKGKGSVNYQVAYEIEINGQVKEDEDSM